MSKHETAYTSKNIVPLKLFFSYSHRDDDLRVELGQHLVPMEREGLIVPWHDRKLIAGDDWAGRIDHHLGAADLILLLVSSSFVASTYCYDVELKSALARDATGEVRVIPVILRPADWQTLPFGKLQALPRNAKPITTWENYDEAFLDVALGIRDAAGELLQRRKDRTRPENLGEPAFLLHQISKLMVELENEGDNPARAERLRKDINRLRQRYQLKYGRDLSKDDERR